MDTLTYDMLPRPCRWILKAFRILHPRWIHALLEVRMAYLNQAIYHEISTSDAQYFRIISLRAGYDVRSIRMLNDPNLHGKVYCYVMDLPTTVASKNELVEKRLVPRHQIPGNNTLQTPTGIMIGIYLNDTGEFQRQLHLLATNQNCDELWHTIFVIEGVLMYLEPSNAVQVLQVCADAMTGPASLCFADRLFERSDCNHIPIQKQLDDMGWRLKEWAPSPTANAKHMGIAQLS